MLMYLQPDNIDGVIISATACFGRHPLLGSWVDLPWALHWPITILSEKIGIKSRKWDRKQYSDSHPLFCLTTADAGDWQYITSCVVVAMTFSITFPGCSVFECPNLAVSRKKTCFFGKWGCWGAVNHSAITFDVDAQYAPWTANVV